MNVPLDNKNVHQNDTGRLKMCDLKDHYITYTSTKWRTASKHAVAIFNQTTHTLGTNKASQVVVLNEDSVITNALSSLRTTTCDALFIPSDIYT